MKFESDDFPMIEVGQNINEWEEPVIVRKIMEHIHNVKSNGSKDISLLDIIVDFSFKNDLDVQTVGDIISEDEYFKSFIEKDCKMHNIIKNERASDEW